MALIRTWWVILFYLSSVMTVQGQKYYDMWPYGYAAFDPPCTNCKFLMDFREDTVQSYPTENPISIRGTIASVCDSVGNLLVFTNGHRLVDGNFNFVKNGSDLNPNLYLNPTYQNYDCHGCHTMINWGDSLISLFHIGFHNTQNLPLNLRYLFRTQIIPDLYSNGWEAVDKNSLMADGAFELFNLVKHGNGKDYWLIQPILQKDSFNFFYVSPDTMYLHHTQQIGPIYEQGHSCYARGMNSISPNGKQYVRFNNKCGMWLYDLDRCKGELSNPRKVNLPILPIQPGATTEFSGNSRYLYYTSNTVVYQVDTEVEILTSDTVAVYDGYTEGNIATRFFQLGRMPDGRIYISSTNGVESLHVIEYPDSAGMACQVNQHSFPLPGKLAWGILRYPNVWLGPSDCDSTNSITSISSPLREVRVFPNPANSEVQLILEGGEGHPTSRELKVFNVDGREVYKGYWPAWSYIHRMDVSSWAKGVYYFHLYDQQAPIASGKIVVLR